MGVLGLIKTLNKYASRVIPENQKLYWLTHIFNTVIANRAIVMSHGIHYSSKIRPTQERVKEALSYCKETGLFHWKEPRRGRMFLSVAGNIDSSTGYCRISLDDRSYYAAKLAWLYTFGEYPECVVDHINQIRDDDRLVNLRLATQSDNIVNCGMFAHNTSGYKGVYYDKSRTDKGWAPWWAYINCKGKRKSLGYFTSKEEAAEARRKAELKLFGEFSPHDNTKLTDSFVFTNTHNELRL